MAHETGIGYLRGIRTKDVAEAQHSGLPLPLAEDANAAVGRDCVKHTLVAWAPQRTASARSILARTHSYSNSDLQPPIHGGHGRGALP